MDLDRRPLLVFWESTRACLLACRHCRASAISHSQPGELTREEGIALLQEISGFGRPSPVLVLTGGDVLMRRDLRELVRHARKLDVPVALAPSVTPLLTAERMAELHSLGVAALSISLDGASPETHEDIRKVEGHFAATLSALRFLRESGFKLQINTCVMRENVEELPEIAGIVRDVGAAVWEVFFLVPVGRGVDLEELSPVENEDVCHVLFEASRYGFIVRTVEGPFFRRVLTWRKADPPAADPAVQYGLGPLYRRLSARLVEVLGEPDVVSHARAIGTRDGKGILFVSHTGDVYPAGFLPLKLANVGSESIVHVYREHELLRRIRAAEFSGRCGVCPYADLCGGSRARAFASSGDPLGEDPACAYVPPT